jgi:hypothetical protein
VDVQQRKSQPIHREYFLILFSIKSDRERDRERDRDRHRETETDRDRDRNRNRERQSQGEIEKEREGYIKLGYVRTLFISKNGILWY